MTRRGVSDGVMRELPQSRAKGEQLLLLFAFTHCLQLPVEGPGSEEKAVSEGLIHGQFTIYAQPLSQAASSSYGINESPSSPACSPAAQPGCTPALESHHHQYCITSTRWSCHQAQGICFYGKGEAVLPAQTQLCSEERLAKEWVKP